MAILRCKHCDGEIDSDSRRPQCRACGALFPFNCTACERKLRAPFPIFEDERYLTMAAQPEPLCEDHFLRKCPDCAAWFAADENPGYFRCGRCAQKAQSAFPMPEWSDESPVISEPLHDAPRERPSTRTAPSLVNGFDANTLILGAAGCAFLVLMGWLLLAR